MNESCLTCRFWSWNSTAKSVDNETHRDGTCHRSPPQIVDRDEAGAIALFPITDRNEWCGEWRHCDEGDPMDPRIVMRETHRSSPFADNETHRDGTCHRSPPQIVDRDEAGAIALFPITDRNEWCGE